MPCSSVEPDLAVVLESRIVSSGIVFTVSGPISSSTYMTSRYSGFFVDVEAQSGRCGVAPFEARKSQRVAGEELLVALVGELRVRDRELPLELVMAADLVEALVGLGVDARDEEARDRGDRGRVAAPRDEALEPADVGARDLLVALQREDQRDVDGLALRDHVLDRGQARLRRRDLHEEVRLVDEVVQADGLGRRSPRCRRRGSGRPRARRSRPCPSPRPRPAAGGRAPRSRPAPRGEGRSPSGRAPP